MYRGLSRGLQLVSRKRGRALAVLATAALVAPLSIVPATVGPLPIVTPGVALAANTRTVCFGSPGTTGDPLCDPVNIQYNYSQGYTDSSGSTSYGVGLLTNSTVTLGGATAVKVVVQNVGTQTVNHVTIAGGASDTAPNTTYNALTLPPSGPSLPLGWSYLVGYSLTPGLSNCSITSFAASSDSISCSIGQLAAGASASFLIVIHAANQPQSYSYPATGTATLTWDYWFSAYLNEGTSSTGSNADTFFALGNIEVQSPNCSGASTYTLDNEPVSLPSTFGGATGCATVTTVSNNQPIGGNGAFTQVTILPLGSGQCPDGYACAGQQSNVNVGGGIPVPGGLQWVMDIPVSQIGKSGPKGVIHLLGDFVPTDPATYFVIPLKKSYQCSTKLQTNCWVSPVTQTTINGVLDWEVVFVTPKNGGGRFY